MFPMIVTSDLHLTDNPRDAYRWGLFPWLIDQVREHNAKTIAILGDLTDAKDNHAAPLVNKVVNALYDLSQMAEVIVMMGNHDYLQEGHPFFQFTDTIPNVKFLAKPAVIESCLFLPHTKRFSEYLLKYRLQEYDLVFMHQTVSGSIASNGMKMESDIDAELDSEAIIWSGDIHVPQKIGNVRYVGSPYHVHFGDRFIPRSLLFRSSLRPTLDLKFPVLERFTTTIASLADLDDLEIIEGDQIKIKIDGTHLDGAGWNALKLQIREWCGSKKVELCGMELIAREKRSLSVAAEERHLRASKQSSSAAVDEFAKHEKLTEPVARVGKELLK